MKEVHISEIQAGDTILHRGWVTTVTGKNIKRGGFEGDSLFGDSYRSGTILVKKIVCNIELNKLMLADNTKAESGLRPTYFDL